MHNKEAVPTSPTMPTNTQYPKDQNVYEQESTVNENDALI